VSTVEGVEHLDPEVVHDLLRSRCCLLVDLRGEDRSSGQIDGAVHEPAIDSVPFFTRAPGLARRWANEGLVVFTCQYSAHRAPQCANWYRAQADARQRVAILVGGFRGWEARGLPVQSPASAGDARAADDFAMEQGVKFVQRYAFAQCSPEKPAAPYEARSLVAEFDEPSPARVLASSSPLPRTPLHGRSPG